MARQRPAPPPGTRQLGIAEAIAETTAPAPDQERTSALTADAAPDERDRRPLSAEDAQQHPAEAPADPPPAMDEPNGDLTPPANLANADPLWEVTCPEHGLPRMVFAAPTADVALERWRQRLLLRRIKPLVKRLEPDHGRLPTGPGVAASGAQ